MRAHPANRRHPHHRLLPERVPEGTAEQGPRTQEVERIPEVGRVLGVGRVPVGGRPTLILVAPPGGRQEGSFLVEVVLAPRLVAEAAPGWALSPPPPAPQT
ncbi:MAG TPA: hypothetical protein VFY46_00645, partial [Acidimicrobiia bacterium]|nr:hypothetical protein [Acidimicrobiia bacterium]